jgi:hypothetical protein
VLAVGNDAFRRVLVGPILATTHRIDERGETQFDVDIQNDSFQNRHIIIFHWTFLGWHVLRRFIVVTVIVVTDGPIQGQQFDKGKIIRSTSTTILSESLTFASSFHFVVGDSIRSTGV